MTQNRVPEGVPTGGQFTADAKARSAVSLNPIPPTAWELADQAYGDYARAVDTQNAAAVETAITAVYSAYPSAAKVYVDFNPNYPRDGGFYTLDRIEDADGVVLAGPDNWPSPDQVKGVVLSVAQSAVGSIVENDVASDTVLLSVEHMNWGEGMQNCIEMPKTVPLDAHRLGMQKDQLDAAKSDTGLAVDQMNLATFAAVDAVVARDCPDVTSVEVEKSEYGIYTVVGAASATGEFIQSGEIARVGKALNRYVENLHEGYGGPACSSFLSRANGNGESGYSITIKPAA